jgi:glycosyltransferase involved in cell wall biosynthesis
MVHNKYVLITPARNEEAFIEKTLKAVISQLILPKMWVIVSDGSTDRTEEIVEQYKEKFEFIHLLRIEGQSHRTFSSKVNAFNTGYKELERIEYDYLGILDADVSFDSSYYQCVLAKFRNNNKLGIAGGVRYDLCNGKFSRVLCAPNSVGGPFQFFRRECYEDIGGFTPQEIGGEDAIAEIAARMHGWQVQSFPEMKVYHYRRTGTAARNVLSASFYDGIKHYRIGYHPLFQVVKCIYRFQEKPFILSGMLALSGYTWALCRRYKKTVSEDFLEYFKSEQLARLRSLLFIFQ